MSLNNPKSARRDDFPDFGQQVDRAGKLDAVDPTVARLIVQSGLNDGNRGDDVVNVSKGSWPAAALKPSQTSMVLGKAIGMALKMLKEGKVGGDLGAIVSKDKHILDGHHRWAATILASGTKGKVGGYGANLKGKDLLKVLNIMSKGLFGIRNGKPGKGDLSQFTESNVRGMMSDFVENGIGGDHPWSPESVQSVLVDNFGSGPRPEADASHRRRQPGGDFQGSQPGRGGLERPSPEGRVSHPHRLRPEATDPYGLGSPEGFGRAPCDPRWPEEGIRRCRRCA
jgi:hypothetical protein